MFYETFLSPQVKRGTNFSNKHGTIWDLKPSEIRKIQKNLKTTYNFKPAPSPSPQENKSPAASNKKMLKNRSWIPPRPSLLHTMKTRACLKYLVNDCFWKQIFASNLPQIPSNLIWFKNFFNSNAFHTALT